MDKPWSEVELIREAFHYQSRFDGSTMVFKIDFTVTKHSIFPSLVKDLALLSQTGFRVVIVPGEAEQSDEASASTAAEAAAFHSAARFMTGLSGSRVDAVIGNFVRARGLGVIDGVDMKQAGTVDKFYIDSLRKVMDLGVIPILPCVGWSPTGKPYSVPSDEIAFQAAANLKAVKLFIISLSGGIRKETFNIPEGIEIGENSKVIRLNPQEAAKILEANSQNKDSKSLGELSLAVKASLAGVERVHIIDGSEEGAVLKELFSNLGAGTMIYADEYESIRGIKSQDIPGILRIMEPLMQQGILLRRAPEDIQNKKDDFVVFAIDDHIHACGALHKWDRDQGEIAAIATDPAYSDMGLGRRIVSFLIEKARKQGLKRIFALTIRTHDWFELLGFREAAVESLPEKKRLLYDQNRKSKVFALEL